MPQWVLSDKRREKLHDWRAFYIRLEKIIHRHRPARNRRLRFSEVATAVNLRGCRIRGAIDAHQIAAEQIDIPHHKSSRDEIVLSLLRHLPFGSRAVIAIASHFDGKARRASKELHFRFWADVISRIRA